MARLFAVVIALTGLAVVPATSAQAAGACGSRYGSNWDRGPYSYAGIDATDHWPNPKQKMLIDAASPYPTTAPGDVHMWHNNGPTQNQLWCLYQYSYADGSYGYQVRNYQSGLCLDPEDDNLYSGDPVWLWSCKSRSDSTWYSQLWNITKDGSWSTTYGTQTGYYFMNNGTGNCLDVKDFNPNDGAALQIWTCSYAGNQVFF